MQRLDFLGVSVFKHDGSSERVRFLADRGVSPAKTYFALHAVPIAILSTALVVYGLWNLMISHREYVSSFATGLPTLLIMLMFVVLLYGVSQWVSQFVRTLILSVILAPILSFIVASWLVFAFSTCGFPVYGVVLCGIAPFAATFVMMRRYMDTRDRPSTFLVGGLVVAFIVLLPIGHAASSIRSVQGMKPKLRSELLAEARQFRGRMPRAVTVSMYGYTGERIDRNALDDDKLKEFVDSLGRYSMDPAQLVKPLTSDRSDESVAANIDLWNYRKWHGSFLRSRIQWRQDRDEQAWSEFTPWLSASAKLLSALRRSTILSDQEVADRLEVLLVDTIKNAVPQDRKEDAAVQAAIAALGTPASRAAARRKAVLVTWHFSLTDSRRNGLRYFVKMDHQPPGLLTWLEPRLIESFILAMLEGIDAAESQSADRGWRLKLHDIHQTGGVFETSRYGDMFRSMPAMETMSVGQQTGFGQLWGRDWEYIEPATIVETP